MLCWIIRVNISSGWHPSLKWKRIFCISMSIQRLLTSGDFSVINLHQLIYMAYHATPLAGHVGVYKTYWRIAARYYWPGMYNDIRKAAVECGHCILGNNVSHQNQPILGKLDYDEPFDIICLDIYVPKR
jgi:hypothetical protein